MPRLRLDAPDPMVAVLRVWSFDSAKLARAIGCHPNTARSRLKRPETLTLQELRRLDRAGVPIDQIRGAV